MASEWGQIKVKQAGNAAESWPTHVPPKQRSLPLKIVQPKLAMSPYRIADAARISPFPSNLRAQEPERPDGTVANSTSGSGSGTTSTKARLIAAAVNSTSRSTRNAERSSAGNARQPQEEEVKFNIGPRNIRNLMSRRHGRGGRSARAMLEGIEEGRYHT